MKNNIGLQSGLEGLPSAEVKELAQKTFDSIKEDEIYIFWDHEDMWIEFYVPGKYTIKIYDERE